LEEEDPVPASQPALGETGMKAQRKHM